MSAATSAWDVVPFGVATTVVCSQDGLVLRHPLLEERRAARALGEPLQQHRAAAHGAHERLGDAQVVLGQVGLGLAPLGEVDLLALR